MVKHVVMWKFKDSAEGRSKRENMEWVREHLYALRGLIPEIKNMEIGLDVLKTDASMDLVLLTEFDSLNDLSVYANNKDHLKVAEVVRAVTEKRVVIDYSSIYSNVNPPHDFLLPLQHSQIFPRLNFKISLACAKLSNI